MLDTSVPDTSVPGHIRAWTSVPGKVIRLWLNWNLCSEVVIDQMNFAEKFEIYLARLQSGSNLNSWNLR